MRVVLDTNIFVSALITQGTPPDQLFQAWLRGGIDLVTSTAQIDEIKDDLIRPKILERTDRGDAGKMVSYIYRRAILVSGMPVPSRSPDPKDDIILATAVTGDADLLVTGDKRDILSLGRVENVTICTARQALALVPLLGGSL